MRSIGFVQKKSTHQLSMSVGDHFSGAVLSSLSSFSQVLADTSIGEEEVLAVSGQVSDLPDPIYAVGFAALVLLGVGALQFTLGDLTKEEGQARVRDFLATKKDTERNRGYFD
mgnify:CR=1 FL=1